MPFTKQLGLLLTIFFAYFLLQSRELPWNDGKRMHLVAEAIVKRGAVDIPPTSGTLQRDGKNFSPTPLLTSLVHVPGAFVHDKVAGAWPELGGVVKAMGSHLAPAALAALTCLLFALLCRDLGASPLAANLGALTVAFATMVAVYARSPWSEALQTAAFTGFYLWLLRVVRAPTALAALLLGLWAGMLINTKAIYAVSLPGAAALAGWHIYRAQGPRRLLQLVGWAALGALPGLVMLLAYNSVRTGATTNIGYNVPGQGPADSYSLFSESPLFGLYGLFLSPGKSLFLYSPPLLASLLLLPRALRARDRLWFWALLLTAGPVVYVYSTYVFWHGDWCWGPRYLLFLVPAAMLPAVFAFDQLLAVRRRQALAAGGVVFAAGLAVQVLAGMFYWDHFIRIREAARLSWLGAPTRAAAVLSDDHRPFDGNENLYPFPWLPAFTPIEGHLWLARHAPWKHPWPRAEADAPWHRYTTRVLDASVPYSGTRLDWWYLDWKHGLRAKGTVLLVLFIVGLGLSVLLWVRRPPAARARPAAQPLPAAEPPAVSDARS